LSISVVKRPGVRGCAFHSADAAFSPACLLVPRTAGGGAGKTNRFDTASVKNFDNKGRINVWVKETNAQNAGKFFADPTVQAVPGRKKTRSPNNIPRGCNIGVIYPMKEAPFDQNECP
jgi:hypothetical protein